MQGIDFAAAEDPEEHEALHFLTKYMPAHDRASLSVNFLLANVKLALQVRLNRPADPHFLNLEFICTQYR